MCPPERITSEICFMTIQVHLSNKFYLASSQNKTIKRQFYRLIKVYKFHPICKPPSSHASDPLFNKI
ncbi:hypothetical protein BpHYR1_030363 [Brachionus plicatilis]|uniref:Uncharacterized protein n=1 Tax=Brachionus plicatilis TaxID=10195 RepID=A0A3M7QZV9_BRAPC|nr:hypothetical protein BpHYR1_030363 [Brachionus plicatilis]